MGTTYRSDKSNVVISTETYPRAYCQNVKVPSSASARGAVQANITTINVGTDRLEEITQPTPAVALNDCILISGLQYTGGSPVGEVRKIINIEGTNITLNAPLSLFYSSGVRIVKLTDTNSEAIVDKDGSNLIQQPGYLPGAYDNVSLADPNNTFNPHYGMSLENKRAMAIAFQGVQSFEASIPSVALLSGRVLKHTLGEAITYPNKSLTPVTLGAGSSIKRGALDVNTALAANDYIVFAEAASGQTIPTRALTESDASNFKYAEVRQIVSKSGSNARLNFPLTKEYSSSARAYTFATADVLYFHDIRPLDSLPSLTLSATHRPAEQSESGSDFNRKLIGGKMASLTLQATEDRYLSADMTMMFLDGVHNQSGVPGYCRIPSIEVGSSGSADADIFKNQELFYFIRGDFTFEDATTEEKHLLTVRSVNFQINNGIEPRYYAAQREESRYNPTFLSEQKREYQLSMLLTLPIDATGDQRATLDYFKDLQRFDPKGVMITLTFQLQDSGKYIKIKVPGDLASRTNLEYNINKQGALLNTAPHSIGGTDPLEVEVNYMVRDLSIIIKDSIPLYD